MLKFMDANVLAHAFVKMHAAIARFSLKQTIKLNKTEDLFLFFSKCC